ncbi:MAG: response regulator [Flavobacterium sp.]|uniref:response regulator n=1 Tax=Flavobacterium sp. TaxID=239 RepID=UPI0032639F0E
MRKNVLHIDDDEDDLEIFSAAIQSIDSKIKCISVNNAVDALKRITSRELAPEVIFIDLNMPRMDGFQFLAELKKVPGLNIPVIVLSTSSHMETINKVNKLGADGYVAKPNTIKEFVRLLSPFLI